MDEFKCTNTAQLTREEFLAIEKVNPDDPTALVAEESMDPPSFTRTHCQRILEIESGAGLEDIHKMLEEKASTIEMRLEKIESADQEEQKSTQLVPYVGDGIHHGLLVPTSPPIQMKRESSGH